MMIGGFFVEVITRGWVIIGGEMALYKLNPEGLVTRVPS